MVDVFAEMIGMVKTNTKLFCKYSIKNLTKDWPGGYYLMSKRSYTVPMDRLLIYIGYRYNYLNFISFIATEGSGNT